jgi:hypothetical protein
MIGDGETEPRDTIHAAGTGVSARAAQKPKPISPACTPASTYQAISTPRESQRVNHNIKISVTCGPASRFPGKLKIRVSDRETTLLSLANRTKCLFAQDVRDAWYLMGMRHQGKLHLIPANATSAWPSPSLSELGVKSGDAMQLVMCRRSRESVS